MVFVFLIRKGSESFPNLISLRFVRDIGTCHFNDSRDNILMNYEMLLFRHMFAGNILQTRSVPLATSQHLSDSRKKCFSEYHTHAFFNIFEKRLSHAIDVCF